MADSPEQEPAGSSTDTLNLEALKSLDFGPSWADGSSKPSAPRPSSRTERDRRPGSGRPRQGGRAGGGGDRRPRTAGYGDRRPPHRGEGRGPEGRRERGNFGQQERREGFQQEFKPTVKVDLYPQDEAFDALVNRLRASARTYQLFEIAQLILEKPERFVAVVTNFPGAAGAAPAPLHFSVPGHLPFANEEDAVAHVMEHHLDLFFEIGEIEVEPPKGNFQMVNRCSVTGELLGPPNYHRYQEFLQRHYAARIHGMSFERFVSKVESVKEQESIDAWVENMKKGFRYTLKERAEGEPESFESLEAVRHFLLRHRKDKIVGSGESVRFAGRDIERIPAGDLRRSVETYIERQRHFPLESANNLRGRLRRHKFAVYKKGSKGVSYVCAVKRKFRDGTTLFTDSIRNLIEFIEKNPMIPAARVSMEYLGIDGESQRPERLKVTDAEIEAAKEARVAGEESGAQEAAGDGAAGSTPEAGPESPDTTAPPSEPAADASLEEERIALKQLMLDLRWLVTEGYVTEYGDGKLFAPPPMPKPKKAEAAPVDLSRDETPDDLQAAVVANPQTEDLEPADPNVSAAEPEGSSPVAEAAPAVTEEPVAEAGESPEEKAAEASDAGEDAPEKN